MAEEFELVEDFEVTDEFEIVNDFELVDESSSGAVDTIQNLAKVYPALETLATLATTTYGLPISGLAGLAGLAVGDIETAAKFQEETAKTLIHQPMTLGGQQLTEAAFMPFEKLAEIGEAADVKLTEAGHPLAGAIAETAIEASPIAIGGAIRGAKALRSKGKPSPVAPTLNETTKRTAESDMLKKQFETEFAGPTEALATDQLIDPTVVDYSGVRINKAGNPWVKYVGEPVWDNLVMKKTPELLDKIPGGKAINRAFLYDYRGDLPNTPKYIASMEAKNRLQSIGKEYAVDLGNRLQAYPENVQLKLGEHIKGGKATLTIAELEVANEAKSAMYELGRQAVDVGLLDEKVFFKNAGQYMPRLYTRKEHEALFLKYNMKNPDRLDLSRFKSRKDIPAEIRKEMGEILTPGFPIAKGVTQLTHDISTARYFNGIAVNSEWAIPKGSKLPVPEGWKSLPSNKKLGRLEGADVHPEIFADLMETIRVVETPERVWRKSLGAWKFGKVILSPKTHARNMMSNSVLAHLGGLPMYEQPSYLTKASRSMRSRDKYWNAIKGEGGNQHTFTTGELNALFNQVEGQMKGIKAGGLPEKLGTIGNAWEGGKKSLKKAANLYEAEEQWFKTAKYIHNIERKGMDSKAAWLDAEKWLFNYSKVTRAQEKFRSKWYGAPFATFTFKAIPRVSEAAIKTPWRFALPAAMIYALEESARAKIGDTKEQYAAKKELRPEWMRGSTFGIPNFARVPIIDEDGREHYLNLTYILPWGDIGEGGGFGPIPGGVMPFTQPFLKEPIQQIMNYDNFWEQPIVKETDIAGKTGIDRTVTEAKIRGKHIAKTLLPTPILDIAKIVDSVKMSPDYRGRIKNTAVVAADVIGGIKIYPVSYTDEVMREISKTHPRIGRMGRRITGEIRTLAIKKQAMEKRGQSGEEFERQIQLKVEQLRGLAEQTQEIGNRFEETKPAAIP